MAQVGEGQTQTLGMCHPVLPVLIPKDSSNRAWRGSRHVSSKKTARFSKQSQQQKKRTKKKKYAGLANHSTDGADQIAQ